MNMQPWLRLADRVRMSDGYTYAHFAHDLVQQLTWLAAVDVATALRGHVYGSPSGSELHTDVRALYEVLGWEQSALVVCWFRDSRNRPGARKRSGRRPGGWPGPTALHDDSRSESA